MEAPQALKRLAWHAPPVGVTFGPSGRNAAVAMAALVAVALEPSSASVCDCFAETYRSAYRRADSVILVKVTGVTGDIVAADIILVFKGSKVKRVKFEQEDNPLCGGAAPVTKCTANNPSGSQPKQCMRAGKGKSISVTNPAHKHYRPTANQLHNVANYRANNFKKILGTD